VFVAALQVQTYRPSSFGDLVDAVGSNRDGLEDLDLSPDVSDYAMFIGEALGVAARPEADGPIAVLWRRPRELWRYRFISAADAVSVRISGDAGATLGRIDSLKQLGPYVLLATSSPEPAFVLLNADLTPAAFGAGLAHAALPSGVAIVEHAILSGQRVPIVRIVDPRTRQASVLFEMPPPRRNVGAALSQWRYDERTDVLRFSITVPGAPPAERVTVECRAMTRPARTCRP
jgi:hypothetical protein